MELLDNAKKIIDCINGRLARLPEYGFELMPDISSSPHVYVNKSLGVVVKRPYLTTERIPECAPPTLVIPDYPLSEDDLLAAKVAKNEFPSSSARYNQILVQPIVDVSYEASNEACRILEGRTWEFDMRTRNFGMYEGQPVMIDW